MALTNINTGYTPEFALGAMYAGENAATNRMGNQLDLIKNFLANQREQQMQPMDVNIKQTESDYATMKRASDYMDAAKRGYIGQMNTQDASGRKALETNQGEIDLANATNRNQLTKEQFLKRLNDLKASKIEGGVISFPTQPTEAPQPTSGFSWQIPRDVQRSRDQNRIGILQQEKQLYPNDPNLTKELELAQRNIDTTPSQPQAVNANNSPLVPSPPLRNGGITQGSPEYEAIMQALVDQPEFRQKLLIGDQRYDSAEFNKMLDVMKAREATARKDSGSKPPKTFEEFIARILEKKAAGQELSPAEIEAWDNASGGFNAKNAAKIQPGTKLNLEKLPNVPLEEKPVQQQYAPSTSAPQSKSKLSPEERAAIIKKLTESK